MRGFLKNTLLNAISLSTVALIYTSLIVPQNIPGILWAGAIFTLINYLVKPLIKLFLLPINLITLGLFRWLANVIILFILTKVLPTVQVISYDFIGFNYQGFTVPAVNLSLAVSLILVSFLLSFVFNLLSWLLDQP